MKIFKYNKLEFILLSNKQQNSFCFTVFDQTKRDKLLVFTMAFIVWILRGTNKLMILYNIGFYYDI